MLHHIIIITSPPAKSPSYIPSKAELPGLLLGSLASLVSLEQETVVHSAQEPHHQAEQAQQEALRVQEGLLQPQLTQLTQLMQLVPVLVVAVQRIPPR